MWLDELAHRSIEPSVMGGRISIGGASPAAETDSEHRNLSILRAGGVLRIPVAGEKQLILACGDGEYALLGKTEGAIPQGMEAGEICLETKNAAILLKNNGKILITGELELEGSLRVNGRSVNGV